VGAACRPAALFIPVVAVAYSIKEVESYLRAILQWQLNHNFLSEIQRACTCGPSMCCWQCDAHSLCAAVRASCIAGAPHPHTIGQVVLKYHVLMARRSGGGDRHPPAAGGRQADRGDR
jgi:hypothetical protein